MGLAATGPADQDDIALVGEELAAGQIMHQGRVDRGALESEVGEIFGQRQPGDGHLVLDRAGLFLCDLGREQVADHSLRLVLALHRGGDDLVIGGSHAVELQPAHRLQNLRALHHTALLRRSYRAQSAAGACRSLSASGVTMVIEAAGSRRRARMFKITSAEWTRWPRAS
jgi:hypothetical protein